MTVFIGGSISIQHLGKEVKSKLTELMNCKINILVGDANGVDRLVQEHLKENWYWKVWVYASNGRARNNVGNWNVRAVEVSDGVYGRAYYTPKDIAMTKDCDYGFMIWDGTSQGTL